MKFAIITHAPHGNANGKYFAYAPYVREMNIWLKYTDEVLIVAPLSKQPMSPIDLEYTHGKIDFRKINSIDLLSVKSILKAIIAVPLIVVTIFRAMQQADHIHLRCPGNIGLLGCIVQIFFPGKKKSAKYAGNWDPKASQPKSYKLQRWILNNTFLTRNMQVLVYGQWDNSSKNIRPFFTASYRESDKIPVVPMAFEPIVKFLFVGSLAPGKRPLYAVKLIEKLSALGHYVQLELYGDGKERGSLEKYITQKSLSNVTLMGNQNESAVRQAYQSAHFLILPSQSEGWPKVVAEAMFWGCLPIATPVSCVPFMLGGQERGLLLQMDPDTDAQAIDSLIKNPGQYRAKVSDGILWSRMYTLDLFESKIKTILST